MTKNQGLGPSNDEIPDDELILAKLLQTAGAHDLVSVRGQHYNTYGFHPGVTKSCCAHGANDLDFEKPLRHLYAAIGNDAPDGTKNPYLWGSLSVGWNVGAAFEVALRPRWRK